MKFLILISINTSWIQIADVILILNSSYRCLSLPPGILEPFWGFFLQELGVLWIVVYFSAKCFSNFIAKVYSWSYFKA